MTKKVITTIFTYFFVAVMGVIFASTLGLIISPIFFYLLRGNIKNNNLIVGLWALIGFLFFSIQFTTAPWELALVNEDFAYASGAKNVIINGIKECFLRDTKGLSTNFLDVPIFKVKKIGGFYFLKPFRSNSCYSAQAQPKKTFSLFSLRFVERDLTWFSADFNSKTGEVSKICGDSSKPGCEEGNTWQISRLFLHNFISLII